LKQLHCAVSLLSLAVLAACAAPHTALLPSTTSTLRTVADTATGMPGDTASGMPGDTASGMPGDTASGLPGDTASGLPGDTATGLPGAKFSCAPALQAGEARCTLAINTNIAPLAAPNTPAALIPGYQPADLANAYALPTQNAGTLVAIVDAYDDPSVESDLAVYRSAFGLTPCTTANGCFRKVDQSGTSTATTVYPAPNQGWSQEISLDVEMVSAACPNCRILLVETNSALMDDLGAGVDSAYALGARVISNSYYAAEWANELGEGSHYNHPGAAITVSSGDLGKPSYPAASSYVTAVGGTSLSRGVVGWNQSAWKYAGHGCSAYVARPDWQSIAHCHSRAAVDLSVVADPQTGVAMFDAQAGGWLVAGGTSVGAPLVAGAYALSGNPQGPRYAYQHRSAFDQLASSAYDLATGLGAPQGVSGL